MNSVYATLRINTIEEVCMGREKRIWYPGAEYHVMNRGNRRGDIFESYNSVFGSC